MYRAIDDEFACKHGVPAAFLFEYFKFFIKSNETNKKNFHDGYFWVYNSMESFCEQFPFLKKGSIRSGLKVLREAGLLHTGNYNQTPYDRTLWYSFTESGYKLAFGKEYVAPDIDEEQDPNALFYAQTNQQERMTEITYKSAYEYQYEAQARAESNPSKNNGSASSENEAVKQKNNDSKYAMKEIKEMFEAVWKKYPRKEGKAIAEKAYVSAIKGGEDPKVISDAVDRFARARAGADPRYTPHGGTWFYQRRWLDEPQADSSAPAYAVPDLAMYDA